MFSARAAMTAARRRGFMAGSGSPILAETVISRASFPNNLDLAASCRPLRCIMFLNWEWPAMVCSSTARVPRKMKSAIGEVMGKWSDVRGVIERACAEIQNRLARNFARIAPRRSARVNFIRSQRRCARTRQIGVARVTIEKQQASSFPKLRPRLLQPAPQAHGCDAARESAGVVGLDRERAQRRLAHRRLEARARDLGQEPRQWLVLVHSD